MRDLKAELEDFDGEYPPPWKPQPGDILVAEVLAYDEGYTSYGPQRTVLLRNEENGERVSLWLSSTVLLREFERLKPSPGERVGIKYFGKDPEKKYHRYRVRVDRPQSFQPLGGEVAE